MASALSVWKVEVHVYSDDGLGLGGAVVAVVAVDEKEDEEDGGESDDDGMMNEDRELHGLCCWDCGGNAGEEEV